MGSLGSTLLASGDLEAALELQTEVVATNRRVWDAEHKDMIAIGDLAATHGRMGNQYLALPLLQEMVDAHRRTKGDGHADTLSAIANLARSYNRLCEFERVLPLRREVVKGRRLLLGPEHPDTLVAVENCRPDVLAL